MGQISIKLGTKDVIYSQRSDVSNFIGIWAETITRPRNEEIRFLLILLIHKNQFKKQS